MSIAKNLFLRESDLLSSRQFRHHHQVTKELIDRLGLHKQLTGHSGCVNCIQWSDDGQFLASGSDDVHVNIWDPFQGRAVQSLQTGHTGNIFSVKFMPKTNNALVASGAADYKIQLHDMETRRTLQTFKKHIYRVKRMEVTPSCPNILWSASEDGTVMETDIRAPPNEPTILINLHAEKGNNEAKCLSLNPVYPEYLAVGGSDAFIRMYDRRKLKCNVIEWPFNEESVREKRIYLKTKAHLDYDWSNQRFSHYFVAGHLSRATKTILWRKDTYTSTYVTFSPNGQELLANMGSEQIYLFDVFQGRPVLKDTFEFKNFLQTCDPEDRPKNGFHAVDKQGSSEMPQEALDLKVEGNNQYNAEHYARAVDIYNQALAICNHPILLLNRAAAFIKRNWNGDIYSALLDCYNVIQIDASNIKAHLRLIKCLIELKWFEEALSYMTLFQEKFPKDKYPKHVNALETLEKRIDEVKEDVKEAEKKRKRHLMRVMENDDNEDDDQLEEAMEVQTPPEESEAMKRSTQFLAQVDQLKTEATDFKQRFCGHCNTTTDIKEANFFGSDGNFIIAGSDDGKFFIWDRKTTNIIKVLQGDDSIVNCLQPHPSTCLLATSGIDPYVRLWTPMPEDGSENNRVITDFRTTTSENQRRMNADPFESFLMEMGYRVRDMSSDEHPDNNEQDEDDEEGSRVPVQCRTS